jgi:hypothetical protein
LPPRAIPKPPATPPRAAKMPDPEPTDDEEPAEEANKKKVPFKPRPWMRLK